MPIVPRGKMICEKEQRAPISSPNPLKSIHILEGMAPS